MLKAVINPTNTELFHVSVGKEGCSTGMNKDYGDKEERSTHSERAHCDVIRCHLTFLCCTHRLGFFAPLVIEKGAFTVMTLAIDALTSVIC